jgi:cytochrome c biogenesis protein CcmG, thiol:disulfide interchange protein DsbE
VLAIAVDDSEETMSEFLSENGYIFPVMLDKDNVAAEYGVRAIPTNVVLDSEGEVVKTLVGGVTAEELSSLMDDLTG